MGIVSLVVANNFLRVWLFFVLRELLALMNIVVATPKLMRHKVSGL